MNASESIVTVFFSALIVGFIPGPTNLLVLDSAIRVNKLSAFKVIFGSMLAVLLHIAFTALGVSQAIASIDFAYTAIKLIGSIMLIWLSFNLWRVNRFDYTIGPQKNDSSFFMSGFFINFFNPKVLIFFLAIIPQIISYDDLSSYHRPLMLGVTFMSAGFLAFSCIALLGEKIKVLAKRYEKWYLYSLKIVCLFFAYLAVRIII